MNNVIFKTTNDLLKQLANELQKMSQSNKAVHISLSGGSTPNLLFEYIATSDYANNIQWQQLHFWWGDERCVDKEDPESNYGQCKQRLFDHISIPAENIHRIRGENPPAEEVLRYAQELKVRVPNYNNIPQFDWIILGMGEDGHTASIFPEQYAGEDKALTFIATQPQTGQLRISKTAYLIEQSQHITYLVMGKNKAKMIQLINTKSPDINRKYPAAYIRSKTGNTEFYLDSQAAKLLLL
ncbi:6-phosphogluconolactonase [Psychromonas algicola]|uniref:6-phosphogluconolactonase n=1 Tax=Psychromonas algicola TaxID=2555642 RepID=UPI001067EE3A|nr:6-phosphogluconolactonase [Psychromonas sp. RZ5]TEW47835.1 6-phosphogluconolactonase [Psychromonas sp. RZ5]